MRPAADVSVRAAGLVALGGTLGAGARHGLTVGFPQNPLPVLGINLLGAFLLGLLVESLARRGPDVGVRRALRLFAGTGVLGGFTTYSTFATAVAAMVGGRVPGPALLLVAVTLGGGVLATVGGVALGGALGPEEPR